MKVSQCHSVRSGPDHGTRVFFTPRGTQGMVVSIDHETIAGPSPATRYLVQRIAADAFKVEGLTLRFDFGAVTSAGEVPAHMTIETAVQHGTEELLCLFPAR